jgi:hypothetical protein
MEKKHVFLLSYLYHWPNGAWTGMLVGVYSSLEKAEQAIARLRQRPGFRDYPDGFRIDGRILDEDYDDPAFFADGSVGLGTGPGRTSGPVPGRIDQKPSGPSPPAQ